MRLTMGLANLPAGLFGAVPMCHGTGGLAAHYRFGARTGGAPVIIGIFFVVLALPWGISASPYSALLPNSVLGVLLIFAGLELCPLVTKPPEQRGILRCPSHRGYRPRGSQHGVGLRDRDCGRHLLRKTMKICARSLKEAWPMWDLLHPTWPGYCGLAYALKSEKLTI